MIYIIKILKNMIKFKFFASESMKVIIRQKTLLKRQVNPLITNVLILSNTHANSILLKIEFFPASGVQQNISLGQIKAKFFGFKKFKVFFTFDDLLSRLLFEGRRPFWCS